MKKYIAVILMLFLTTLTYAQEVKKGFQISFKGGLTLSNQYGKDVSDETFLNGDSPENFYANNLAGTKLKIGVNIGGLVDYRLSKRISLGLGINYIQKGAKINVATKWNSEIQGYEDVDGTAKWIQNYGTVDLPVKIYFPVKQNELHLLGGLTYGHLFNSKEKGEVKISGTEYSYTNERGANNNELGFLLGVGYDYLLGNKKDYLTIGFTWNRSLGTSYGEKFIGTTQKYYNQTFSLTIGYKFDLRK